MFTFPFPSSISDHKPVHLGSLSHNLTESDTRPHGKEWVGQTVSASSRAYFTSDETEVNEEKYLYAVSGLNKIYCSHIDL
jgi:hypothetical protein